MPELFDNLNEHFFNPLTGSNRKLYFDCINELIRGSEGSPVLYEDDALHFLTVFFMNWEAAVADDDSSGVTRDTEPRDNARIVLNYFRNCGWIGNREIAESGGNLAQITVEARRIIGALNSVSGEALESNLSVRMMDLYRLIREYVEEDELHNLPKSRPYENFLKPMQQCVYDISQVLSGMHENIRQVMKNVYEKMDVNSLCHIWMEDEYLEQFFTDYNFMRSGGHDTYYMGRMSQYLYEIEKADPFEKMARGYCSSTGCADQESAMEAVKKGFGEARAFVAAGYARETAKIDRELRSYYERFENHLSMVRRSGYDMGHTLNGLLLDLSRMDEGKRKQTLADLNETWTFSQVRCMSEKTFRKPREAVASAPEIADAGADISDEDARAMAMEEFRKADNPYSTAKVKKYINSVLRDRNSVTVSRENVGDRRDALMFLFAAVAAEDPDAGFRVSVSGEDIQTDVGEMSGITVMRKEP